MKEWGKNKIKDQEKTIKCKCGKYWGMKYFRMGKICQRCNTAVAARGG